MSQSNNVNGIRVSSAANIRHDASTNPGDIWRFFNGMSLPGCCTHLQIKRRYPVLNNSEGDKGSKTIIKQRKKRKRRGSCTSLQADRTRKAVCGDENSATIQSCAEVKSKTKKKRHNKSVKRRKLRESSLLDLLEQKDDPFTDGFPMGCSEKLLSGFVEEGVIPFPSNISRRFHGAANDALIKDSKSDDRIARSVSVSASDTAADFNEAHLNEGSLVTDFTCIKVGATALHIVSIWLHCILFYSCIGFHLH